MCTRYYIESTSIELSELFQNVKNTMLADTFIRRVGRPIITAGEVRPTDIVPVIAPNSAKTRTVFPMQWGFKNPDHDSTFFNARSETAATRLYLIIYAHTGSSTCPSSASRAKGFSTSIFAVSS